MKKSVFIFFLILAEINVQAQITQAVIASSGGFNLNGNLTIGWTLGETVIPVMHSQDGTLVLTQGFQQKLVVTTIEESLIDPNLIKVYPNPVEEVFYIELEMPLDEEICLELIDYRGNIFKTGSINPPITIKQVNLQGFPGGVYYLRLTSGKRTNVYKVVKL